MCGRYQLSRVIDEIQVRFNVEIENERIRQIYNAAPTQDLPVITNEHPGLLKQFRWGLVPFWAKEASIGNKLINARAEGLSGKPSFRQALQKRRCLVPANGFYEWKKEGKQKIPHRIFLKNDALFAFAGLWERWTAPEGHPLYTFTIITTTPNELMKDIHDRMPVILTRETERTWLDTALPVGDALEMMKPYPADDMMAYPVSPLVNNVRNDSPELIKPLGQANLF